MFTFSSSQYNYVEYMYIFRAYIINRARSKTSSTWEKWLRRSPPVYRSITEIEKSTCLSSFFGCCHLVAIGEISLSLDGYYNCLVYFENWITLHVIAWNVILNIACNFAMWQNISLTLLSVVSRTNDNISEFY